MSLARSFALKNLRPVSRVLAPPRGNSGYLNFVRFASAATMTSGNTHTVSDVIKHDHKELKDYYDQIVNAHDNDTKVRYQNQFVWELARHSIGEELVVYPAMEKVMGAKGKQLADKDREEHRKVKELLYKFQDMNPADKDFKPTLETLMSELSQHIREEEEEDLPALEKALADEGTGESEKMATSFGRTKMFVPTRSHPSAPDRPPFETVAGLMAAPMDRLGDMFRKFPTS